MSPLTATVRQIDGNVALLELEDGQSLRLPLTVLEGTPKPGSVVRLLAVTHGGEDAGRQAIAKHLLNELLGRK
jgi:hypothetical protein